MGMKIITGNAIDTSVEAEDDRSINAAVFGKGEVVFDEGSKFDFKIIDNNTLKILDGGGSMQGVVFRIPYGETETLKVDTCATGYKRIDIICAKYFKDNNNTENVTLEVVKGVETQSNNVQKPKFIIGNILENALENYMPLYEIYYEGTNITEIKKVFNLYGSKIIFRGPIQMGADTVIKLSEPVSRQKTGIVLIWSPYGTSGTNNIQYQFIPKEAVKLFPDTTHSTFLCNTTFTKIAGKSVYVHDDTIEGNKYNTSAGTGLGVSYNNADYTLRYVLGY